jgi:hypothetical protein
MNEYFSPEQAKQQAHKWCSKNPAWLPICDLGDTEQYYVQWDELPEKERQFWGSEYAYDEFGTKRKKVKIGFITGKGEFYSDINKVPLYHNMMMVFKVGVKARKASEALSDAGQKDKE